MSERKSPQASYGVPADASQQSGRDLRLDLFRGLALIFIFIDQIPDNVLSYLTLPHGSDPRDSGRPEKPVSLSFSTPSASAMSQAPAATA